MTVQKTGHRARRRAADLHNISRIDSGDQHSWLVRIVRGDEQHGRSFSDSKHRGKRRALAAARAWRDEQLAALPQARNGGKRTPSGISFDPGHGYVRRATLQGKRGPRDVFVPWLRIEERRALQTSYSTAVHGVRGAERKAFAWLRRERRALRARLAEAS